MYVNNKDLVMGHI